MEPPRGVNATTRYDYTDIMRFALKFLPAIVAGTLLLTAPALIAAPVPPPAPAPAPAPDAKVPFQVGEALTYDVSWSSFLTAGQVTLRVAKREGLAAGRAGYQLVAEAQTVSLAASLYQLYYRMESVVDTASLAAVRASSYSKERGKERVKSIWFGPNNVGSVEIRRGETTKSQVALPPHTLDALSAIYLVRALRANPGESLVMPIVDGTTVSRLRLTFGGREPVKTGLGTQNGWRVTPTEIDAQGRTVPGRRLTLWLSDDAARRPIRLEAALPVGSITLALAKVG